MSSYILGTLQYIYAGFNAKEIFGATSYFEKYN